LDLFNISSFGHYISFVRDASGKWFKIDDDKIDEVE